MLRTPSNSRSGPSTSLPLLLPPLLLAALLPLLPPPLPLRLRLPPPV